MEWCIKWTLLSFVKHWRHYILLIANAVEWATEQQMKGKQNNVQRGSRQICDRADYYFYFFVNNVHIVGAQSMCISEMLRQSAECRWLQQTLFFSLRYSILTRTHTTQSISSTEWDDAFLRFPLRQHASFGHLNNGILYYVRWSDGYLRPTKKAPRQKLRVSKIKNKKEEEPDRRGWRWYSCFFFLYFLLVGAAISSSFSSPHTAPFLTSSIFMVYPFVKSWHGWL